MNMASYFVAARLLTAAGAILIAVLVYGLVAMVKSFVSGVKKTGSTVKPAFSAAKGREGCA